MKTEVEQTPLLQVNNLKKHFPVRNSLGISNKAVKAVDDVSFTLYKGETFCLVGESGCGKSTIGRSVLRLIEPTDGEVLYEGENILEYGRKKMLEMRRNMQIVFQDPYSSFNPNKRIGKSLVEALNIHRIGDRKSRIEKVMNTLSRLGFQKDQFYRYPYEFSGGQQQRIGVARALTMNPELIVCDEPVSALDVSIQSQILNILMEIQQEFQLTYLFISHDLSVVRHIADRIAVMYLGKIVEVATTDDLFSAPKHPYTQMLLSAIPKPNPHLSREKITIKGEIPSPLSPPSGCYFHTRCPFAMDICKEAAPKEQTVGEAHSVACHLYSSEEVAVQQEVQ